MSRPKMVFSRAARRSPNAGSVHEADYRIYATYRRTGSGAFIGDLKVVRTTDNKVLFPFDGAPTIGPFETASEAREAARLKGEQMVALDLVCPE
ncbi:hypothetical protein B0G75_1142 [Paraburkholderia sp. BL18I3N2]|uniref:DUF6723 family protein n=1 Tax=Paraburkholderia sp. BL18I3N2 TaxID=1938799 RepID=UPI000D05555B|nr:DUF6723 family protein [Paraburkholderia sp. BL18I3N2]PRX27497.1 hypothetical protein B0G75_1142 [Paraburkholderia sp. BL18I3N2]